MAAKVLSPSMMLASASTEPSNVRLEPTPAFVTSASCKLRQTERATRTLAACGLTFSAADVAIASRNELYL